MKIVSLVTFFLTIIGALNWLMVGATRFDLAHWAFGRKRLPRRIAYGVVGVAGLTQLVSFFIKALRHKHAKFAYW